MCNGRGRRIEEVEGLEEEEIQTKGGRVATGGAWHRGRRPPELRGRREKVSAESGRGEEETRVREEKEAKKF